ncbi:MAG TPA: alpha/beta hydrolase [Thermoanaerobaculia bacterium]|jgi:alpha-beta hydrolase superfamily lysophospholipase
MIRPLITVEPLRAHDGMQLVVERHLVEAPRARVVILHGYAEHRRRYDRIMQPLVAHGFECIAADLRGHGDSTGQRGHVSRFSDYLDDLQRIVATVGRDAPRYLVGHSLGGLISLQYVLKNATDFDGVAVSSPFVRSAFAVSRTQVALARVAQVVAPRLPFRSPLRAEQVSRDPEEVALYANDPAVFRTTTPRWYSEVTEAQKEIFARAPEIHLPLLMLLGTADSIADPRGGMEVFERLGSADKSLEVYPGYFHEVFNDVGREAPIARLVGWLETQCASTASSRG